MSVASIAAKTPNWSGTLTVDETEDLIGRSKIGDRQAFAALYRAYVPLVYAYVGRRVQSHKVEDFVAEVFVRALKNLNRYEFRGREFSAWLLRIARNLILDSAKSGYSTREVPHGDAPEHPHPVQTETEVLANLDAEALRTALGHLKPEHRQILELRYIKGCTGAECAAMLGKNEGAVRVLQYRALQSLKKEVVRSAPHLLGSTDS